MKRIYSIILLLSFLVGTIQPILPMIEIVFTEGVISELVQPLHADSCSINVLQKSCEDSDCCNHNNDETLLDMDFYPIPLQITASPHLNGLFETKENFSAKDEQLIFLYYQTLAPPPKFA